MIGGPTCSGTCASSVEATALSTDGGLITITGIIVERGMRTFGPTAGMCAIIITAAPLEILGALATALRMQYG